MCLIYRLTLILSTTADAGHHYDEFGCKVKNGEDPQTECIVSVGNTCSKPHECQSVLQQQKSGRFTKAELEQSERIAKEFM
ncbi:MAG: hypothetical protein JSU03_05525 [Bacteroidetes bacterium]|nr:hypothetical protein [Bacteroidota bacterium]MBS1756718.1 hypothetical protein [Bacteroidota bacterium]